MAGDHVHQETQGERDRAQDEGRQELHDRHERQHDRGNARGEQRALEEVEPVLLDAGVDEHHVGDHGEHERQADDRRSGDIEARDDSGEVQSEDQEEHRHQDRHEALAVLLAERLDHDVLAHEADRHLGDDLAATGNDAHLAGAEPEQQHQHGHDEQPDDHDPVQLERSTGEENRIGEEIREGGTVETTVTRFVICGEREE